MILNSNSNLGIQTMEFQILCCIRRPKHGILKSIDFNSGHFKSVDLKFKSKSCYLNTTSRGFGTCMHLERSHPRQTNPSCGGHMSSWMFSIRTERPFIVLVGRPREMTHQTHYHPLFK